MIAFGKLKMLKVVIIILSKEKRKRKERGSYHDWYKHVMVGYVGDIMVHNINNNFSLKKNITNNSCVLYFKITNHNFSTL